MNPARRLLAPVPVLIALPIVQAALLLPGPVGVDSTVFVLLALLSFAAAVVAAWLLATVLLVAVEGAPSRPRLRALLHCAALGLVVVAVAVLNPLLVPPVLVVAAFLLPAVAAGDRFRVALGVLSRHPWRSVAHAALYLSLVALGWITAAATGLFVTGPFGALLCWFAFALLALAALSGATALYRRP